MASLRELQHAFAAALRDPAVQAPVSPAANLGIYRNNSDWQFRSALAASFPVLKKRVGDEYFRQLAFHYRAGHPSRSGDLHWVGRAFAGFLAVHLRDGDYAWLADLARLEWAREVASVSETRPAIGADCLSRFAPEDLGRLVFELQPGLQLLTSDFPVHAVWLANQGGTAAPVNQSQGSEWIMVLPGDDGVTTAPLTLSLFSYLSALLARRPLAEAVSAADLDEAALLAALQFTFGERLVCAVEIPDHSEKR